MLIVKLKRTFLELIILILIYRITIKIIEIILILIKIIIKIQCLIKQNQILIGDPELVDHSNLQKLKKNNIKEEIKGFK